MMYLLSFLALLGKFKSKKLTFKMFWCSFSVFFFVFGTLLLGFSFQFF